jgi:hypothetical protein
MRSVFIRNEPRRASARESLRLTRAFTKMA